MQKESKIPNYFISVFRDGHCVLLDRIKDTEELRQLMVRYADYDIEAYNFEWIDPLPKEEPVEEEAEKKPRKNILPKRKKMRKGNLRAIYCIETLQYFESVYDAAQKMNIPYKSIYASLHRPVRAYGYTFSYADGEADDDISEEEYEEEG